MSSNRKTGKSSKAQLDEIRGTNDVSALGLLQVTVTSYIKTQQVNGKSNEGCVMYLSQLLVIIFAIVLVHVNCGIPDVLSVIIFNASFVPPH